MSTLPAIPPSSTDLPTVWAATEHTFRMDIYLVLAFLPRGQAIVLPPGTGGGCIFSGPFKDYTVNLGPLAVPNVTENANKFAYNPRCLKRDLTPFTAQNFTSFRNTTDLIFGTNDITSFQTTMDGDPRVASNRGLIGVHGGGHFTIAGDPGKFPLAESSLLIKSQISQTILSNLTDVRSSPSAGSDFKVSPGDPAFFLRHGRIDRLYTLWQSIDPGVRQSTIPNITTTLLNIPPSTLGTLDDIIDISPLAPPVKIRDVLSTTKGPFCYIYE